ncbi:tRNA-modifying protein YgfZ [Candidatus Planktophila dulcis]|uniref:CAF17-like 4Fe-4S cluster assembly/insertion protein YgfZ n=1 Tax=Candidatus Planktophila dulcis TaxID=1884914 RepID=UPI000BAC9967|nr:folate-binding protein YgfZ [Candidatus Planktophila dulcis]ASY14043.1 tRNA-modifying protein YgfZ [Candidatus Planktophila dulcis]
MTAVLVEDGPDKGAIWHFGEPNKEQRALAEGKAWADLSHLAVIAISGEDRLKWLHDLTTQYLVDAGAGIWLSAMILDPQGHVEYQFNVVDDGTTSYLVMDPHFVEGLSTYLNKMRFMLRVEVRDATQEFAVMRAPGAANEIGGPFALVPRAELDEMKEAFNSTATQVGTWALDAERVAAGRPRHGIDTDFKSIPNELGVLNGAVHMNKGCYRGQETVAKIYNLGKPPRRLVMLHLDGHAVVMPPTGTPVMNGEVQVGFLGTVARHHELGPIALAIVKRNTPVDAQLMVEGVAASQQIIVEA